MLPFPKPLLRIYWSEVTLIFLSLFQSAKSWAWAVIFLEHGRGPLPQDRDARPPCQCFAAPCLVNIDRSKSNVSFSKKNLSQSGPVPLKINSFGGKKTRSLLLHKMRRCEQAQTGAVAGWRGKGRQTKEGQEKEEGEANSSQGSLHTGHFGSYYFVNGWSCFEMFRLDKQLKWPRFSTTWDRDAWEARGPHRWFLSNWAARVKKGFRVLHWHLFPFQVPFFMTAGIWGGILIPMSKKLKAAWKDVLLQRSPSVLARLKSRGKSAKLLPHSSLTTLKLLLLKWIPQCLQQDSLRTAFPLLWSVCNLNFCLSKWTDTHKSNDKAENKLGDMFLDILIWIHQTW